MTWLAINLVDNVDRTLRRPHFQDLLLSQLLLRLLALDPLQVGLKLEPPLLAHLIEHAQPLIASLDEAAVLLLHVPLLSLEDETTAAIAVLHC